ncbi:MAG: hypothetical protein IIA72_18060 [Proteobacteria bacterium]|nr:hypothetical protein [Pseudomonadota bacterium]
MPTTQISLIREHTEKIVPPRALWVPFELGRPFGAPDDSGFQKRVLLGALALLEAEEGPILADFPDEAPGGGDITGWACPINLAPPPGAGDGSLSAALEDEMARLLTWYDLAVQRRGRTTVGASGLGLEEIARFLLCYIDDQGTESPNPDLAIALKHAVEDLKAFYMEAATARPGPSSARQVADWFWRQTSGAKVLYALKAVCIASDDAAIKRLGHRAIVPANEAYL